MYFDFHQSSSCSFMPFLNRPLSAGSSSRGEHRSIHKYPCKCPNTDCIQQVRKLNFIFHIKQCSFSIDLLNRTATTENMLVERTHQMNRIIWIVATFSLLHNYFIFTNTPFQHLMFANFIAFYCIQISFESRKSINWIALNQNWMMKDCFVNWTIYWLRRTVECDSILFNLIV